MLSITGKAPINTSHGNALGRQQTRAQKLQPEAHRFDSDRTRKQQHDVPSPTSHRSGLPRDGALGEGVEENTVLVSVHTLAGLAERDDRGGKKEGDRSPNISASNPYHTGNAHNGVTRERHSPWLGYRYVKPEQHPSGKGFFRAGPSLGETSSRVQAHSQHRPTGWRAGLPEKSFTMVSFKHIFTVGHVCAFPWRIRVCNCWSCMCLPCMITVYSV